MLDFHLENEADPAGVLVVAGTDEAGRGPLAGSVYAAAVILPRVLPPSLAELNDSKKLTPKKRELLYDAILSCATDACISSASVEEIDTLNILCAAQLAMQRAVSGLKQLPDLLLVDGNIARGFPCPVRTVVGGDGISPSIAAASVLAKVSRDRACLVMDALYPQYGFAAHKGYGTPSHCAAIRRYGPCPLHRKLFLRKIFAHV